MKSKLHLYHRVKEVGEGVLGGGTLSALSYAHALLELGYRVEIIGASDFFIENGEEVVYLLFGEQYRNVKLSFMSHPQFLVYMDTQDVDVFVNHSKIDHKMYGRINLLNVCFPSGPALTRLDKYDWIFTNSGFTQKYLGINWGDQYLERTRVLYPPIGDHFIREAHAGVRSKKKQIVTIGRYGQEKNQLLGIKTFKRMKRKRPELMCGWTLYCVGSVSHTGGDLAKDYYYNKCKEEVGDFKDIHLCVGMPSEEMFSLLCDSYGYLHTMGAFNQPPGRCEHFGLSIFEAAACGCVPLIYDQLLTRFEKMIAGYQKKSEEQIKYKQICRKLSISEFTKQLKGLCGKI